MEGREVGFRAEFRCGSNLVFSRAGCCSGLRGSSNCFFFFLKKNEQSIVSIETDTPHDIDIFPPEKKTHF